jgi:hypothetical protein
MLVGLVGWTITDFAFSEPEIAYVLVKAVTITAFLIVVCYSLTQHFKENYIFVTVATMIIGVLFKFLTEIWFLREGGIASAMVPMITYGIFNVHFVFITYINVAS